MQPDIGHVHLKPATPRLNGTLDRSHRIDTEKRSRLLEGATIDGTDIFSDHLLQRED